MTVLFFSIAALFALVLLWVMFYPPLAGRTSNEVQGLLKPLHLPAVFSLIDSKHEQALRGMVSAREMRLIERARNKALIDYFSRIASNSAVLLRAAQWEARLSPDSESRQQASRMAHLAFRTRISAVHAIVLLYLGLMLPSYPSRLRNIGLHYQQLLLSLQRAS